MDHAVVPVPARPLQEIPARVDDPAAEAYRLLLEDSRSAATRAAYASDLADFARWLGHADTAPEALRALCSIADPGPLALLLGRYKGHLRDRHLAESTINRRLSALRAYLRMARRLGAPCPDPAGLVSSEKSRRYRDTRGPALSDAARLLRAPDGSTPKAKRDRALIRLLLENALRRAELVACNLGDFERQQHRLWIRGKGRGDEREAVTLSDGAVRALVEYLDARGTTAGDAPLFVNHARHDRGGGRDGGRLTGRGLAKIVSAYGQRVLGRAVHPHALRHSAITQYLDVSGGDIRGAQRLSRHKDIRTLALYDDNRADLQGRATALLSDLFTQAMEEEL